MYMDIFPDAHSHCFTYAQENFNRREGSEFRNNDAHTIINSVINNFNYQIIFIKATHPLYVCIDLEYGQFYL